MARIFWVECPDCRGKFYGHHADLRHATWKMRCPFCDNEFAQEESLSIWE